MAAPAIPAAVKLIAKILSALQNMAKNDHNGDKKLPVIIIGIVLFILLILLFPVIMLLSLGAVAPMLSDDAIDLYDKICTEYEDKYDVLISRTNVQAIDAVIYDQDFSKATESHIRNLVDRFLYEDQKTEQYTTTEKKYLYDNIGNPIIDPATGQQKYDETEVTKERTVTYWCVYELSVVTDALVKDKVIVKDDVVLIEGYAKYDLYGQNDTYDLPPDFDYGDVEKRFDIPLIYQFQGEWADYVYTKNHTYDTSQTISTSGCGIVSAAMVMSAFEGKFIDPRTPADYAMDNGYRTTNDGTSHGFFAAWFGKYGYHSYKLEKNGVNTKLALKALVKGYPVIVSVGGPSVWTQHGHFIVLAGVNSDGTITVNDPGHRKNNQRTWSYSKDITPYVKKFFICSKEPLNLDDFK